MAQREGITDDFLEYVDGMWTCPVGSIYEELGIAQSVISRFWQRFQDDGNSDVDVTAQVALELQRRIRTGIWQLLPHHQRNRRSIRPVSSALFSYPVRFPVSSGPFYGRLGAHCDVSICS
ncbi:hypothetical protein TNCV_3339161 [Trichonephila clavipes]|nr:hypothetical protein TNCV_3339161 [Trichonephila clavipes]